MNIDQIIRDTIALIRQHAKDNRIKIVFENHLAAGFNQVIGKSGQLKYVFLNLFKQLFNALSAGGEMRITASNDGEKIDIILSDPDGSFADEFSGCQTYEPTNGQVEKGCESMDLSICYNIIRHHRGEISGWPGGAAIRSSARWGDPLYGWHCGFQP